MRKGTAMKKAIWIPLALTLAVMIGSPFLAVTFAPGDAGMAIVFLLFFGGNPLYSLLLGVWSGMDWKRRWFQIPLCAAAFLAGTWLFFDPGEMAFLYYSAFYLLVGIAGLALGRFLGKFLKE